jgi:hypothetical protein
MRARAEVDFVIAAILKFERVPVGELSQNNHNSGKLSSSAYIGWPPGSADRAEQGLRLLQSWLRKS